MPTDARPSSQTAIEDALLADALLGGGLPEEAEHHLWLAGQSYHVDEVAETHLKQAEALAHSVGRAGVVCTLWKVTAVDAPR